MCILVSSFLWEGLGLVQLVFYAQLHLTVCIGTSWDGHLHSCLEFSCDWFSFYA
jgi:hypothetical protein